MLSWSCSVRVSVTSPFHLAGLGGGLVGTPPEGNLPTAPRVAGLFSEKGEEPEKNKNNMNTTNTQNNIAAPSITIAPRNPAKGVVLYVVTITTYSDARSYPCRSLESAQKLVERFMAGVLKPRQPKQADSKPAEPVAEPAEVAVAA